MTRTRWELPQAEVRFNFTPSSGPGGQNVNRRSTRVEAVIDLERCGLDEVQLQRARSNLGRALVDGEVRVIAETHRTQHANRKAAVKKLEETIRAAVAPPPPPRRRTRPTRGSVERRLKEKKRRGVIKKGRSGMEPE